MDWRTQRPPIVRDGQPPYWRIFATSLVVEFDEDTALEVVRVARPDIYAKGGDYVMTAIPEGQEVIAQGGKAVAIDFAHDRSTSKLVAKIRQFGG